MKWDTRSNGHHSRRRFLKGMGTCLALPLFESLATSRAGAAAPDAPLRMAFVTVPNGVRQQSWWPEGDGEQLVLNRTMEALRPVRNHIQIIRGLEHLNANPGPDGAGDHARANATFLTGVRARKTAGTDIQLGISVDQLAAQHVGHRTRFASLELTCDKIRKAGRCDSGYSCAYLYNISWQSATTPMTPEPNPRLVFERLFGAGPQSERQRTFKLRQNKQKSVIDFVLNDANALQEHLGNKDRQKLDEFLTGVRGIEQRIVRAEQFGDLPNPDYDVPAGIPADYGEHMRLMFDLLLLAFQTDSTRVATLLLAGDGTNYTFPQIGIPEGHHYLSHKQDKPELGEKVTQIDRYYVSHFAQFLENMQQTKEADGHSLLDNSMIIYGGGIADGNLHTHTDLPVVLAGGGGGTLRPGRYVKLPSTPMCNLFVSMLDRMGVTRVGTFGDSTGRIEAI